MVERRLEHENGEARRFTQQLAEAGSRGHRSDRLHAVVRAAAGGTGPRIVGRRCRRDSRLAWCGSRRRTSGMRRISAALAGGGSLSADLDAVAGRAGPAATVAASRASWCSCGRAEEPAARVGHGPGLCRKKKLWTQGGPQELEKLSAWSRGPAGGGRSCWQLLDQLRSTDRRAGPGGAQQAENRADAGSSDDASGRGTGDRRWRSC